MMNTYQTKNTTNATTTTTNTKMIGGGAGLNTPHNND